MKCSLYVIQFQLQTYWPVNALKEKKGMVDNLYLPSTPKAAENKHVMFTLMLLISNTKRKKQTKTHLPPLLSMLFLS